LSVSRFDGCRLSLGGTSGVALAAFLERNPRIGEVALCLDADDAGRTSARKIAAMLAERYPQISAIVSPPEHGEDYNDMLMCAKQRERAGSQKSAGVSL
jgi:DNA primase